MRRSLIFCRLAMLASQQAAKQSDDGLLRAYHPLAEAARATDIKPIWRATSVEVLQQALDRAEIAVLAALDSNDHNNGSTPRNRCSEPDKLANEVGDHSEAHCEKARRRKFRDNCGDPLRHF
jgi:hypothetical protein